MKEPVDSAPRSGLTGRQLLDRYRVRRRIARGGMSILYLGDDTRLHRPVCIKVFTAVQKSSDGYRHTYDHFVQEAFALSQLQHPTTLRIYDFGYLPTDPACPFQVSEYLGGGTLDDYLRRRGRLDADEAYDLIRPLAEALGEAHGRGILHRDIKPSNILFTDQGDHAAVKLADFGIAKVTNADAIPFAAPETLHGSGARMQLCSVGWASPEQVRAEAADHRTDIYSLGLILAYALTGETFFSRSAYELIAEMAEGDAFAERRLASLSLAPDVKAVLRRALRSDRAERFDSILEMKEALRAVCNRPPSMAPTRPLTTLHLRGDPGSEVVAAQRRIRIVAGPTDLEFGEGREPARVRVTLLPDGPMLHVRGLNCFVHAPGHRPSTACTIEAGQALRLLSAGRRLMGEITAIFPFADGGQLVFPFDPVCFAVETDGPRQGVMLGSDTESSCLTVLLSDQEPH